MKNFSTLATILTLALCAGTTCLAQDPPSAQDARKPGSTPKPAATVPTDEAGIKRCIEERLAAAPSLAGQKITVEVRNKFPRLTGKVQNSRMKGTATRIANGKSCGGRQTVNDLEAAEITPIKKQ